MVHQSISNSFFYCLGEIPNLWRLALFSPACSLCENTLVSQREEIVCSECLEKLEMAQFRCCKKCGKPVKRSQYLCGDCLLHPPPFSKHIAYTYYDGIMKELIILYKFGEVQELKRILANCVVELCEEKMDRNFDCIVPVPADSSRRRGFNRILEIAEWVSKRLDIPLLKKNLFKRKSTIPQVGLGHVHRLRNLKGAFSLKDPKSLQMKKILLIDDVFTTGTTVRECSKVLSKAGAVVSVATLARSQFYE